MYEIQPNVWIFDGKDVPFLGLPFSTRMTVIRLDDGTLWVHSPIALNPYLKEQIDQLGDVCFLIAPNHLHHLFVGEWQAQYPQALTYGTAQVIKKRQDLRFENSLAESATFPWDEEIEHLLFTGSSVMQESVFLHKETNTLIVTDLIENFDPQRFKPLQRNIAKVVGILSPNGKMPLDWRLTFQFHKKIAREHMLTILSWHPQRIIMSHGEIIESQAESFLVDSFGWLGDLNQLNK